MGIELTQKLVASTLIIGGLGGGYFALTGGKSGTLSGMHKALGREENTDWESVAEKYKEKDQKDLIEGIKQDSKKLAKDIEKWCNSNKNTYYLGDGDQTDKSYSIWCLKEAKINEVLEKKNFKWLNDKWDKKLEKYKKSLDDFIKDPLNKPSAQEQQRNIPKDKVTVVHITEWCNENRVKRYKYHGDDAERRVRLFCYWTDNEIEEAKKLAVPEQPAPADQATVPVGGGG